jgi:hypothetical protein
MSTGVPPIRMNTVRLSLKFRHLRATLPRDSSQTPSASANSQTGTRPRLPFAPKDAKRPNLSPAESQRCKFNSAQAPWNDNDRKTPGWVAQNFLKFCERGYAWGNEHGAGLKPDVYNIRPSLCAVPSITTVRASVTFCGTIVSTICMPLLLKDARTGGPVLD